MTDGPRFGVVGGSLRWWVKLTSICILEHGSEGDTGFNHRLGVNYKKQSMSDMTSVL